MLSVFWSSSFDVFILCGTFKTSFSVPVCRLHSAGKLLFVVWWKGYQVFGGNCCLHCDPNCTALYLRRMVLMHDTVELLTIYSSSYFHFRILVGETKPLRF